MNIPEWEVPAPRSGADQDCAESIGAVLRRQARVHGKRRAVGWEANGEPRWLTYAQLAAHANAVAHRLAHLSHGDRIAVWGRPSAEGVLAGYACALRGLVLVPLNPAWTDAEVSAALELAAPALLFAGTDNRGGPLEDRARALARDLENRDLEARDLDIRPLDTLLNWAEAAQSASRVDPAAPFLLQLVPGPSGSFKGTLLSHSAAISHSAALSGDFEHDGGGPLAALVSGGTYSPAAPGGETQGQGGEARGMIRSG
jgi:fatty-acyl-CoA synthase